MSISGTSPISCGLGTAVAIYTLTVGVVDAAVLTPSANAPISLPFNGSGSKPVTSTSARLLTRPVQLARRFPGSRRLALVLRQKGSQLLATLCVLL